jgi:murein DD-endopeptidase MepM/ murein hydrolase activator NlpD
MKKIYSPVTFLLFPFFLGNLYAQDRFAAPDTGTLTEYRFAANDAGNPCITPQQYMALEQECNRNIARLKLAKNTPQHILATSLAWPIRPAGNLNDCGYFFIGAYVDQNPAAGVFKDFNCGTNSYDGHAGTDIAEWPFGFYKMDHGQVAVVAAAPGTIIQRADGNFDRNCSSNNLTANSIIIQHADGSYALYWHMKKNSVTSKIVGQTVVAGEYLGMVGSSGSASGPHLHFEIRTGAAANTFKDPYSGTCNLLNASSWWTAQRPYTEPSILKVSVNTTDVVFPACPTTETPNEADTFQVPFQGPGLNAGYAKFYAFEREIPLAAVISFKILNPDGTTFNSWQYTISTYFKTSFLGFSKLLPVQPGTYTFMCTYNGITCAKKFEIITAATLSTITDTTRICGGQNILLASGYPGINGWQWQQDVGGGFVNIVAGANFSGITADTLHINNPATSWYGRKFRCLVNNTSFSRKYVLKFVSNWTGFISTAWETPANWSCGIVPDANTDVIINAGMPYYPAVNSNTSCRSVQSSGASSSLTVKTGVVLTLPGH